MQSNPAGRAADEALGRSAVARATKPSIAVEPDHGSEWADEAQLWTLRRLRGDGSPVGGATHAGTSGSSTCSYSNGARTCQTTVLAYEVEFQPSVELEAGQDFTLRVQRRGGFSAQDHISLPVRSYRSEERLPRVQPGNRQAEHPEPAPSSRRPGRQLRTAGARPVRLRQELDDDRARRAVRANRAGPLGRQGVRRGARARHRVHAAGDLKAAVVLVDIETSASTALPRLGG